MTYFIFFILLLIFSIIEFYSKNKRIHSHLFRISATLLFLFCTLRYGVGFDYFNYQSIFENVPSEFSVTSTFEGVHGERLFLLMFMAFKSIGINYEYSNSIIIALTVTFFIIFINRYSKYKAFSILILYSWFFIYVFSTLRQGLAMSIFCAFAYPMLEKKSYFKYYLIIFICIFIHSASFICITIPFVIKYFPRLKRYYLLIFLILLCLVPFNATLISVIGRLIGEVNYINEDGGLNILALLNRIIVFFMIFYLCIAKDKKYLEMKSIYIFGALLYLFLAQSDLIASRLCAYFKLFEIILLPLCSNRISHRSVPLGFFIISVYLGFMFMNILGVMADQYGYESVWNYPYVTIFNQDNLVIYDNKY